MDVDDDFDGTLLRNFSCMGTTDKEVLVGQLQNLVGIHLTQQAAQFYLDMADWNVQAAVCAYFDLQSAGKLPQMSLVKDVTIGEGESIPPQTKFEKTWRIKNSGEETWPDNCHLIFTGGDRLGATQQVEVSPLSSGSEVNVSVDMLSPGKTGIYFSKWRMATVQGYYFGDTIWVILQVDATGTLALMQQMENLKALGSAPQFPSLSLSSINPFAHSPDIAPQSSQELDANPQLSGSSPFFVDNANNNVSSLNTDTEMS